MSTEEEKKKFVSDAKKALGIAKSELYPRIQIKPSLIGSNRAVFLFQVKYLPDGSIDVEGRNVVEEAIEKAGFKHLDSCSSRAAYKAIPGKLSMFQKTVRNAARRYKIKIKRILYIPDPGLGLVLKYQEDALPSS